MWVLTGVMEYARDGEVTCPIVSPAREVDPGDSVEAYGLAGVGAHVLDRGRYFFDAVRASGFFAYHGRDERGLQW